MFQAQPSSEILALRDFTPPELEKLKALVAASKTIHIHLQLKMVNAWKETPFTPAEIYALNQLLTKKNITDLLAKLPNVPQTTSDSSAPTAHSAAIDFIDDDRAPLLPPGAPGPHLNGTAAAVQQVLAEPKAQAFLRSPAAKSMGNLFAYAVFGVAASTGAYGSYKLAHTVLSKTEINSIAKDTLSGAFGGITGAINWSIFIEAFESFHLPTGKGKLYWFFCVFSTIANAILSALLTHEQMPVPEWAKMVWAAFNGMGNLPFGVDSFVTVMKNFNEIGKFWKNETTTPRQKIFLLINLALILSGILCMLIGYSEPVVLVFIETSIDDIFKYFLMGSAIFAGNVAEAGFQLVKAFGIESCTLSIFTWDQIQQLKVILSDQSSTQIGLSQDLINKIKNAKHYSYEKVDFKATERTELLQHLKAGYSRQTDLITPLENSMWSGHMPLPLLPEDRNHFARCLFILLFAAIGAVPYSAFTLFALLPYIPLEAVAILALLALPIPLISCMPAARKMLVMPLETCVVRPAGRVVRHTYSVLSDKIARILGCDSPGDPALSLPERLRYRALA